MGGGKNVDSLALILKPAKLFNSLFVGQFLALVGGVAREQYYIARGILGNLSVSRVEKLGTVFKKLLTFCVCPVVGSAFGTDTL